MSCVWKLFLVPLALGVVVAQAPDPATLVRTALAKYDARELQAKDYEYLERSTVTDLRDVHSGNRSRTTTYEVMIVNGHQLRRELHDGRPMTPEEVEQERQQRLDQSRSWAGREVARPNNEAAIVVPGGIPKLSLKYLPYFFDLRLTREEVLDGRNTYVIEAKPKHGQRPSDEIENDLRAFRLDIWIDEADTEIIRIKAVAIHPGIVGYPDYVAVNPRFDPDAKQAEAAVYGSPERYKQGTKLLRDWRKINDEAWLPTRVHVKGSWLEPLSLTPLQRSQIVGDGSIDWPFEEDTVFYNYQKFGVSHRIMLPGAH